MIIGTPYSEGVVSSNANSPPEAGETASYESAMARMRPCAGDTATDSLSEVGSTTTDKSAEDAIDEAYERERDDDQEDKAARRWVSRACVALWAGSQRLNHNHVRYFPSPTSDEVPFNCPSTAASGTVNTPDVHVCVRRPICKGYSIAWANSNRRYGAAHSPAPHPNRDTCERVDEGSSKGLEREAGTPG